MTNTTGTWQYKVLLIGEQCQKGLRDLSSYPIKQPMLHSRQAQHLSTDMSLPYHVKLVLRKDPLQLAKSPETQHPKILLEVP